VDIEVVFASVERTLLSVAFDFDFDFDFDFGLNTPQTRVPHLSHLLKKRPQKSSSKVLGSHRKVGKKFVPPLLDMPMKPDYISWASHTLPELIWWDVLADKASHRFAATVAEKIARYFKGRDNRDCWWAFISDYSRLTDEDAAGLRRHLLREGVFHELTEGLADFLDLYPECPLSRLSDERPLGIVDIGYLAQFENRMRELEDKRSRNGVLIQAQALYLGFILGKLFVKKGLALADFPEVQNYPNSEKSLRVGAAICSSVNMVAAKMLPKYPKDDWVQYFWKRSLDLRPIDFRQLESE
jgi:hypothetical protein